MVALAMLLATQTLTAQSRIPASPFLPPPHWSYSTLRRLDAAGLLPEGSDIARRNIPQEEIAALLERAAVADSTGTVSHYLFRFREEHRPAQAEGLTRSETSLRGGYRVSRQQVLAGIGYDTVWSGARSLADRDDGDASARVALASSNVGVGARAGDDGVAELQLVLAAGEFGIWGGRREAGYAVGYGGGLTLDGAKLDGGGVFLTRPVSIPVVGRLRFETQLSRVDNVLNMNGSESETKAWFWSARGSLEPHRRLRIGVNRAMIFGGDGNLPVTFSRVVDNLIGIYARAGESGFANQVLSVDLRYLVPSAPVSLYLEWGADDAAGAWADVPAILAGVELSGLPGKDASIGVERTEFVQRQTFNSIWYQNAWFRGSWADSGVRLGHALGGHGVEWRMFGTAGLVQQRISADASIYRRKRGERNLYAPQHAGRSVGGNLNMTARVSTLLCLILAAEVENGDHWSAIDARASVRLGF